MTKGTIAACTACLLIGGIVGRLLPAGTGDVALSVESSPRPERQGAIDTQPSFYDSQQGPEVSRRLDGKRSEAGSDRAGTAAGQDLVTVPAALIGELSLAAGARSGGQDLFNQDGRIEEILHITDYEKATVQTAWNASRQKIRDLETASMKTEAIDEWSVKVIVPDLSESVASLGDGFRSKVQDALGENRGEAFMAAKQVDRTFASPSGERSYVITTESIGDGKWRYRFELDGPSGSRVWVGENIPDELRHLTDAAKVQPLSQ